MRVVADSEVLKMEGLEGVLKTLRELPVEVASKNGGPVRRALRKAALPMYTDARQNLEAIIALPNLTQDERSSTGLLQKSLRLKRVRPDRNQNGEAFLISPVRKRYRSSKGDGVTTGRVGALLEIGTSTRRPLPWLRPAFEKNKRGALQIFEHELPRDIERLQKRLERKNGVKT